MKAKGKDKLSRRSFLKIGGASTAYALGSTVLGPAGKVYAAPSNKVYVAADDTMRGTGPTGNYARLRLATECILKTITSTSSESAAWQALGLTSSSKVAIKINCLKTIPDNAPRWETVKALILSMQTVVPAANISLFDNQLWSSNKVEAMYGSKLNDLGNIWHGNDTYGNPRISVAGPQVNVSQRMAAADFGISLLMVRPHCCYSGNLSGLIKNMMGCCSTNTGSSYELKSAANVGNSFHSNSSGQGFVELWNNFLNSKMKLYVGENLFFCYDEREAISKNGKYLYMSQDPCAIDSYAVDLFSSVGGLRPATKLVPGALAAAGLGSTSYNKIDVPVTSTPVPVSDDAALTDLKGVKDGTRTDAQVKATIDKYVNKELP